MLTFTASLRVRRLLAASVVVAALIVGALLSLRGINNFARDRVRRGLAETYESNIEVKDLRVTLLPKIRVTISGLVLRQKGREELPPLISVDQVYAEAGILGVLRRPAHVRHVRLTGLRLHIPPRRPKTGAPRDKREGGARPRFVVDQIIADGTLLQMLPRKPGKLPLEFAIHRLSLHHAGTENAMDFQAALTNAKPPGEIHSTGRFGPWQAGEPAATPVSGTYTFQHADLSVFRGLSGILSSEGSYRGELDHIVVDGRTDVPDFAVGIGGNRVHLTTQYHAIVDGTDGDTYLEPVTARFGGTLVTARGSVQGTPGIKGRTVSLDAVVRNGRLEDVLRLGVRSRAVPMSGEVSFRAKLVIPPGDVSIPEKLRLEGSFEIDEARFTKMRIQQRVTELSNRAKGEPEKEDRGSVASDFRGSFRLDRGVMTFRNLTFRVPSVELTLDGTYGLLDERLNLHGTAKLEARLSETTTGFKSFLLRVLNPFFSRKRTGTVLPIKIEGTRTAPSFGLDVVPGK